MLCGIGELKGENTREIPSVRAPVFESWLGEHRGWVAHSKGPRGRVERCGKTIGGFRWKPTRDAAATGFRCLTPYE